MRKTNWKKFTTAKLEEILANKGVTNAGTAYDFALNEVSDELNRRYTRQEAHDMKVALARINQFESDVMACPPPIHFTVPPIIDDKQLYNF